MPRPGSNVLVFSTDVLKTSELVEMSYNQKWNIGSEETISGITLSQRGSIGLAEISIKAILYNDAEIVVNSFRTIFLNRTLAALTVFGTNYGQYYLNSFDFTYTELDNAQTPLRAEMSLGFLQSVETY